MKSMIIENLMASNYSETNSTVDPTNGTQYDEDTIESLRLWLLPLGYAISFIFVSLLLLCLRNFDDAGEKYLGFFLFVPVFIFPFFLLQRFATCPINQFNSHLNTYKVIFGILGSIILLAGLCCLFHYVCKSLQCIEV